MAAPYHLNPLRFFHENLYYNKTLTHDFQRRKTLIYFFFCMFQVSGVVGRADLLCALLFLSSFLLYIKSCAEGELVVVVFVLVKILEVIIWLDDLMVFSPFSRISAIWSWWKCGSEKKLVIIVCSRNLN